MMTPAQIELARHALGLPNDRQRSYRNYYVAGAKHPDYPAWCGMVARGLARGRSMGPPSALNNAFWLLPDGAKGALQPGESLCSEDFPGVCA